MNDILETIDRRRRRSQRVSPFTLVGVEKWAPRDSGAVPTETVDKRTVLIALAHDVKVDVPPLRVALATPAGYIGARTPAETAISIAPEIVGVRSGRSGGSLCPGTLPVHGPAPSPG